MNHLYIDIETTSGANLSNAGAYRYAEDDHFRVLLFGYAADDDPIRIVNLEQGESIPTEITEALADPAVTKLAYDAQFERVCLSRFLGLPGNTWLNPEQWRCMKVWSSYRGLPDSMKVIASALGVSIAADPEVQTVLREKYIHDLKKGNSTPPSAGDEIPVALQTLGQCIRQNLTAERALHEYLRKYPMPDAEWRHYNLEQRILEWLVRDDWEARMSSRNYVQDEQPRVSEYFHDDPRVTRLCLDIDNAIRRCLTHPRATKIHGLMFSGYNRTLCIELPSGRTRRARPRL